jgi:hypothetical protein
MMFDVDCLTSWLDFCILFIPEVRLFYQVLAETKVLIDMILSLQYKLTCLPLFRLCGDCNQGNDAKNIFAEFT